MKQKWKWGKFWKLSKLPLWQWTKSGQFFYLLQLHFLCITLWYENILHLQSWPPSYCNCDRLCADCHCNVDASTLQQINRNNTPPPPPPSDPPPTPTPQKMSLGHCNNWHLLLFFSVFVCLFSLQKSQVLSLLLIGWVCPIKLRHMMMELSYSTHMTQNFAPKWLF